MAMGTWNKVYDVEALVFIVIVAQVLGSRLPKFVDQQMNNQMTEGIKDQLIPLKQVTCFNGFPINCFIMKIKPQQFDWMFGEFQVSSGDEALHHRYKLLAYSKLPEDHLGGEMLFESESVRPDPILSDIIIDITAARTKLVDLRGDIYFLLICDDCRSTLVKGNKENSFGFVILRKDAGIKRQKRSVNDERECQNDGDLERCCVNKKLVSKALVFENATSIVAPNSIPVTYCTGSCYLNMYKGNHNFALVKYYQSLIGLRKINMMKLLPCCNAKEFRDMAILYVTEDGSPEIVSSRNLIVDSCSCE